MTLTTFILAGIILLAIFLIFSNFRSRVPERKLNDNANNKGDKNRLENDNEKSHQAPSLQFTAKKGPAFDGHDIPKYYGVDRLAALVKDPYWVYNYWELTEAKRNFFMAKYGHSGWSQSKMTLRVYDITKTRAIDDLNDYFDIEVNDYCDNWYTHVNKPDHTFFFQIGRKFNNGDFIPLLDSNIVTTPRDNISDLIDENWASIEELYRYHGLYDATSPSLAFGVSSPYLSKGGAN